LECPGKRLKPPPDHTTKLNIAIHLLVSVTTAAVIHIAALAFHKINGYITRTEPDLEPDSDSEDRLL
jgi:hypothetical protein